MAFDTLSQSFLATRRTVPVVAFLFCFASRVYGAAGPLAIELETAPPIDEVRPQSEPTRVLLTVLDSERKPVPESRVRVRLHAPDSAFFPTDLPAIEGRRLIDVELPAADGTLEWEYLFPIRGAYRLEATVFDARGERGRKVFTLEIRESRLKLFYLGSFILALFLLGFSFGWWLHRTRRRARPTAGSIAFAAPLLLVIAQAHAQQGGDRGELAVDAAVVGKPSRVSYRLPSGAGAALLTLTITDLEKEKRVLFLGRIATEEEFGFDFQFTDGTRYRVTALAETENKGTVRQEKVVTASATPPAGGAVLPSLVLFLGVVALGMAAGHESRRRRRLRMRLR
ncbi:MAG TPA: hypothetical protein VNL14_08325 [Candidatus Acidoferrales bacterium]|nr:hypothetical protein [Candidatus Acidoferrales bacterium]